MKTGRMDKQNSFSFLVLLPPLEVTQINTINTNSPFNTAGLFFDHYQHISLSFFNFITQARPGSRGSTNVAQYPMNYDFATDSPE
jgi:hypothetical protein